MVNNLPASAGDTRDVGSMPELERSPGEGNGSPLQYSCLGNPVDRGACYSPWGCKKSQTQLSMCMRVQATHTHTHTHIVNGLMYSFTSDFFHLACLFCLFAWLCHMACGILIPQLGIHLTSSVLET